MWIRIEDWDHEVNELGQVRNLRTGRILKPVRYSGGRYWGVALQQDGIRKDVKIHQLLGEYFLDRPEGTQVVDHLNRDSLDNRLENLCWITHKENCRNRRNGILSLVQVDEIRSKLKAGKRVGELAKEYGVGHTNICHIKKHLII